MGCAPTAAARTLPSSLRGALTGLDQRLPVFTSVNEAAIVLGYDPQTALEEPDDQWANHIPAGHTATPGTAPGAPQRRQRAPTLEQ